MRVFVADYGHGAEISMLKSEDKATVTAILDIQLQTPGMQWGQGHLAEAVTLAELGL